jgi:oligopeptide/dipeptide ABC transporter ATP-binding protein
MAPLLEVSGLTVDFDRPGRSLLHSSRAEPFRALGPVDLRIDTGDSVAIVGESGCGKTTLARCLTGFQIPSGGEILMEGRSLAGRRDPAMRRRIQMVFQDPMGSLNPAMSIERSLVEAIRNEPTVPHADRIDRARELLAMVDLPDAVLKLRPRQLSGGQRQRVAIARALAVSPDVLVADEAVSALDVSVQATILNLLRRLQRELDLTLIFITHNLAVVRQIANRTVVLYRGRIAEEGPTDSLLDDPRHPYTSVLRAAVPSMEAPGPKSLAVTTEDPSEPAASGCNFAPRCPMAVTPTCTTSVPELLPLSDRLVACHVVHGEVGAAPTRTDDVEVPWVLDR